MNTKVVVETLEAFEQWQQEQQVASLEALNQAVAVNPAVSTAEFLAPYTDHMGIESETLAQVHNYH